MKVTISGLDRARTSIEGLNVIDMVQRTREYWRRRSETRKRNEGVVMAKKAKAMKQRQRIALWQLQAVQNQLEQAKLEAAGLRAQVQQMTAKMSADKATGLFPADGPVFTLKAKDSAAPDAIRFWAKRAAAAGASAAKVGGAMLIADDMEFWQNRNGRKVAD